MRLWSRGFTLIELLIVVAIIAILAAIALPNFLEAQVRAKVSRAKSDIRTISVGLETYAVDNNHYPPDWDSGVHGPLSPAGEWKTYRHLTTPIAYLTTPPHDPFNMRDEVKPMHLYDYYGVDAVDRKPNDDPAKLSWMQRDTRWVVYSYGPDRQNQSLGGDLSKAVENSYDPTNGAVSLGDFGRSNVQMIP